MLFRSQAADRGVSNVRFDPLVAEVPPAVEHPASHVVRRQAVGGAEEFDVRAVLDKFVRPADAFDSDGAVGVVQRLEHRATETTGKHVVLHRDEQRNASGVAEEKRAIERFGETGVHNADRKVFLGGQARSEFEGVLDRKSTRLNSSHVSESRMPSSA